MKARRGMKLLDGFQEKKARRGMNKGAWSKVHHGLHIILFSSCFRFVSIMFVFLRVFWDVYILLIRHPFQITWDRYFIKVENFLASFCSFLKQLNKEFAILRASYHLWFLLCNIYGVNMLLPIWILFFLGSFLICCWVFGCISWSSQTLHVFGFWKFKFMGSWWTKSTSG